MGSNNRTSAPSSSRPRGLVIGGTSSGVGKTTLSLALMAAYRRRGLRVQGFKVGPDFIDPGHHAAITGRASHNLDGWMLPREENQALFRRHAHAADLVIVEGVMGLYDGRDGRSEAGSTAQMAKWLDLPVLLAAGGRSMARSLGAVVLGFHRFDPNVAWAGLAVNQVGSLRHREILVEALADRPELRLRGLLGREEAIGLSERHLGLVTAEETAWTPEAATRLADWVEQGLDLDGLWADLPELDLRPPEAPGDPSGTSIRLGVARDAAFCFYYQENFRRLEEAGAHLVFFSPISDPDLPENLDGLYFGGGYPEVFAARLADNEPMRRAIRAFAQTDRPIYAECGGMMYLGRRLWTANGGSWPMTEALPLETGMTPRLRSLGYRDVAFARDTPLGPAGTSARGHEFHYSEIRAADIEPTAYRISGGPGGRSKAAGFIHGNILADYVHLHFGSHPGLARWFVAACEEKQGSLS
jgi:cobyrinic acid a,c-diamide synthase